MSLRRFIPHLGSGIVVLGIAMGAAGCRLGDPMVAFQIKVDSITVTPPQIEDGSKLQAVFYGEMGPDKCWLFERAEARKTVDFYEVRFFGTHVVRNDCPQSPSKMEFVADILQPMNDPFRITAFQPDGSKLERIMTH